MYFDRMYERKSLDWYRSFFSAGRGFISRGELSHDYFLNPDVAVRIARHIPDAKIIACLREPVSRTLSHWIYSRSIGLPDSVSFNAFALSEPVMQENNYVRNLAPYFRLFPVENILVLFYDELLTDPAAFAANIYRFLGVDDRFVPPSLHRRVLPARTARSRVIGKLAYQFAQHLRQAGMANLVGWVKRSRLFQTIVYKNLDEKAALDIGILKQLRSHYAASYSELEALIGRRLPQQWKSD